MRRVRDKTTKDGFTNVHTQTKTTIWPLVFAAALVVILALGGL
jgi:hypothetical protein